MAKKKKDPFAELQEKIADLREQGGRDYLMREALAKIHLARTVLGRASAGDTAKEFEDNLNSALVYLADARAFSEAASRSPKGNL